MALLTFGEGYHNYHHKFQWDYRNGTKWYNFDPSKWIIKTLSFLNVTHSLRKAPGYSILRAKIDTLNQKIENMSVRDFDNIYKSDIKSLTDSAMKNLDLWKRIDLKYKLFKSNKIYLD